MNKNGVGRAEAMVLRFIADHPGVTVSAVGEYLLATKGQTRTTALNTMERLRKKGFLRRDLIHGVFHYFPVEGKARLFEGLVNDFVESVLGGSVTPLVAYLTKTIKADTRDLTALEGLLKELEDKPDGG